MARECVLLLSLAAIPAAMTAWFVPLRIERPATAADASAITVADARALGGAVLWVDARTDERFAAGHIAGAVRLEPGGWDRQVADVVRVWKPGRVIVVYCDARSCDASRDVAARLKRQLRLREVFFLEGGWAAWQAGAQ